MAGKVFFSVPMSMDGVIAPESLEDSRPAAAQRSGAMLPVRTYRACQLRASSSR